MQFWGIFLAAILFYGCSNSNSDKLIISFESQPTLQKEHELMTNLDSQIPKSNLFKHLTNQNWIDTFLIKRNVFGPIRIFIQKKEPKYIWKEKFYLDSELNKFLYFGEHPNLLHLNMPIEFIEQWMLAEDKFQLIMAGNNLNIISVAFINSEGWSFILDNNLRINLGTDLSDKTYQNLSLALKYIFEKNLTPSIIDLRYKNGAALNYGK